MAFQIQGKLHKLFDIEQKTDSFQAREFILEVNESQYPQLIKFQLTQDKCTVVDHYAVGDNIIVHFDLRGREWKDRYFTNLSAWKLEPADGSMAAGVPMDSADNRGSSAGADTNSKPSKRNNADFDDDIPF